MPHDNSVPSVLSADTVRDYILSRGGKVYNTELVKYFKPLLIHPERKDAAREEFKRIINRIAVVLRDERDEKYLILKRRSNEQSPITSPEPSLSYSSSFSSLPTGAPLSPSMDSSISIPSISKQPPPYRSPPPVTSPKVLSSPGMCMSPASSESSMEKTPPPVPPRRRSSDKIKFNNKENELLEGKRNSTTSDDGENKIADEHKISVKERTQRFNRLASTEEPITKIQQSAQTSVVCKKRFEKGSLHDREEEDCVSVTSFDPRSREWLVRSAQGDYQALAKMCAENPRLAEVKDPATGYTALHWGAKHGNMDIVKLIAGSRKVNANIRTNGGYTPLHIAAQFNRDDVCDLLMKVYGADPNLRDWSGKKPFQYKNTNNRNSSMKMDSIRKTKSQKKHSEKDSGFLRIGSLNVRVKRTTEAVSNFLGVSQSNLDKAHKTWGSADSIPDCRKMPPPNTLPPKKRKPKQYKDGSHSSAISESKIEDKSDSDSDSAVGFGPRWKQTV